MQMDGFYTDSDESDNRVDYKETSTNNLKNKLRELINNGDYGEVRKFIRRNKECNTLNTRELNEDIPADGHKFVKRDGKMQFITCKCSKQKGEFNQGSKLYTTNETTNSKQNGPSKECQIIDAINLHSHLLNQLIDYLSNKCSDFDIDFGTDNFK